MVQREQRSLDDIICSWKVLLSNLPIHLVFQPVVTVMVSEMVVDWLKHAFITKFNHIRPSVYERYTDVLCRDLSSATTVGRHGARKVRLYPI